jgi:hypothetical protein
MGFVILLGVLAVTTAPSMLLVGLLLAGMRPARVA